MKLLKLLPICLLLFAACDQKKSEPKTIDYTPVVQQPADSISLKQTGPFKQLDVSQMDMIFYPEEYPVEKMKHQIIGEPYIRVIYSRPHKKGRKVFGNDANVICPYGKPWRLGANEATEIEFFTNVSISGKNVQRGRYVLYAIPYKDKWTVVLNNNLYSWGLQIDSTQDVLRTDIPVMEQDPPVPDFSMRFEGNNSGAGLVMAWDSVKAILPIDFLKK